MSSGESEYSDDSDVYDPEQKTRINHNKISNVARDRKRAFAREEKPNSNHNTHNSKSTRLVLSSDWSSASSSDEYSEHSDLSSSSSSVQESSDGYDPKAERVNKRRKIHHSARARKRAATREARAEKNVPCSHYRTSNSPPSEKFVQTFDRDATGTAPVVGFRLMGGESEDTRRKPKPNMPSTEHAKMLSDYVAATGHDVPIKVCGPCGKRAPMNKKEHRLLPFKHSTLKLARADKSKLPVRDSVAWKAKHLVCHENEVYHLAQAGVKDGKVIVCASCCSAAKNKTKPPIQFFAHYDVGIIPPYLKPLSYAEKLGISKVVVVASTLQYKKIQGSGCAGVKGHVFALRMGREDVRTSIAKCLPRADLGKRIQLAIHGEKDTYRAVQMSLRKSELTLRLDVMIKWLVWLKKVGHPDYQEVKIGHPDYQDGLSDEALEACKAQLEASVDEIIENASYSDSRSVEYLSECTRAAVSDERDGLNETMSGTQTRTVFLADEAGTDAPIKQVFAEIAQKMKASAEDEEEEIESECQIKRTVQGSAVNDYSAHHEILSGAFPYLFPFGIMPKDMKTGTVPKQLSRSWLEMYDARFAKDKIFLFLIWDHLKRHSVNSKVSFVVKRGGQRVDDFVDLVNEDGFYDRVLHANAQPDSKDARHLQQTIAPMIKICGRTVPWSTQEKNDALGKIYSMTHFFSVGSHWITISPAMRHQRLALRLAVTSNGQTWELGTLPDIELRSKLIADNPVVATRIFYRLLHKFFEILVKCPLEDMAGKRLNVEALFARLRGEKKGIFGSILAAFGVLEEQGSGNLHFHGVLFGGWSIDHLMRHIHKPEVQREMVAMIDQQINCEISQEFKQPDDDDTPREHVVYASEAHPTADQVKHRAQRQASRLNHHRHSATCWRPKCPCCRMGYKRCRSKKTCPCQIIQDSTVDTVKAVRKYPESDTGSVERIDEPPQQTPGNPFANPDKRVIGFCLKRTDEFEQNQVEQNDMCTVCMQCNTSIQPLVTGSQGKAAKYYICKYCAKNPYKLKRTLALLQQALEEIKKYGSNAEDAGTATRQTKQMMQKLLNKGDIAEVSDQQAAARALFLEAYLSTHRLNKFVSPWEAVRAHRERYGEEMAEEDVAVDSCRLDFTVETGRAVTTSPLNMYLYRGPILRHMSHYDHCATIGVEPLTKKNQDESRDNAKYTGIGRPRSAVFRFASGNDAAKCKIQTTMSCPCIPRIAGPPPPEYPGNPPSNDEDPCVAEVWEANARTFIEFYILLFVPLDPATLCPIAELDRGILPWKGIDSWNGFWKMMEDWNPEVPKDNPWFQWYNRNTWRIIRNMIDNLRLKSEERKLVTSWRNQEADRKPNGVECTEQGQRNGDGAEEHDHDHYRILIEHLRAKYGADLTTLQKERKKVLDYVEKQLGTLRNLAPNQPCGRAEDKRSFPPYSVEKCIQLEAKNASVKKKRVSDASEHATSKVKLHEYQNRAVEQMKRCYEDNDQMLVFLQGQNGSGKTFVAKHLSKMLGQEIQFSATTNQASALLDAGTINSLLCVSLNEETKAGRFKEPSAETIQRIIDRMRDKDVLLIDECSMLSPSLLALIDFKLRHSLNKDRPFGGKHVILVGDMVQFKPVGRKYALYEAILRYTKEQHLTRNCKAGAQLFTQFTMIELDGQARANQHTSIFEGITYYEWVSALRDLTVQYPVTDEWLAKFPILTKQDLKNPEWEFAPIAVTGHPERRALNEHQALRFAIKHSEPILRWTCPMKRGQGRGPSSWQSVDEETEGTHDELVRFFVRGAPCILTERYDTEESGITKGSVGYFDGVVWDDEEDAKDLEKLAPGQIHRVAQPAYLLIRFPATDRGRPETVIPLQRTSVSFKNPQNSKQLLQCFAHGCDLRFACTYHSLQGSTLEKLILSLGAIECSSRKIAPLLLTSLLVGTSRVHDFANIRAILADLEQLKNLKQIAHLAEYFANYDAQGKWKMNGLKAEFQAKQRAAEKKMALAPLEEWINDELLEFIKDLDLMVAKSGRGGAVRADLLAALRTKHADARAELLANGQTFLKREQEKWKAHIRKRGWRTIKTEELRTLAKCMGLKREEYRTKQQLDSRMQQLFDRKRKATTAPQRSNKKRRLNHSDKREMDTSDTEE